MSGEEQKKAGEDYIENVRDALARHASDQKFWDREFGPEGVSKKIDGLECNI